jgi:divalent metal cation (Fe/Co/Zn/Cd) transporter
VIATVESLPGVLNCHSVRVRYSGPVLFVDIHIYVPGDRTLRETHQLTDEIEKVIQQVLPNADVVVHPEPAPEHNPIP